MPSIEYALRINYTHFNTPARLRGMVGFCKKAGIREVQLVPVDYVNESVFPPRAAIAARRALLTGIIRHLADHGIAAGYCVLRTFYGAAMDGKDHIGFKQPRVDMSGNAATLHPCPLDSIYLDYIKYFYAELARTGPASMMVDDDFRYECIKGLGPTCFCPLHLKEFKRRFAHNVDRESLKTILEQTTPSPVKNDWMEFKRVLLLELAGALRETVHKINPNIRMGLMLTSTEISAMEGRDHRALVEMFAGDLPPLVRPGQGCYAENNRLTLLTGLADTVYQSSLMSANTEIQAEVDFYPHSLFNKSAQFGFDYQIKANLACNIKKINIWPFDSYDAITEKHPYAGIMARTNKVLNSLVRAIPDRAVMCGIRVEYSQKAAQLRPQRAQAAIKGGLSDIPPLLWRLGIPFTFADSSVVILTKDSFPMPRERLALLLQTKNVFMDCDALAMIATMGFTQKLGVKIAGPLSPADYKQEFFMPDVCNGAAAGCYMTSRGGIGDIVKIAAAGRRWRAATRLIKLNGARGAPGMLVAGQNGRRLAVCACRLRDTPFWVNEAKQAQMQAVLAWLSGGTLPAVVRGAPDICPVLLDDTSTGTRVLSLINASTSCADGFAVELAAARSADKYRVRFMDDDGRMASIPAARISKRRGALCVKVAGAAKLQPYQVRFLFVAETRARGGK